MGTRPQQKQIEDLVCQQIRGMYQEHLGHQPGPIVCQLVDDKLIMIIENNITQVEQVLLQAGQRHLVERVRNRLDVALQPYFKAVLERVFEVPIIDLLVDTTVATGRTGGIALLGEIPDVSFIAASKVAAPGQDGQDGTQAR